MSADESRPGHDPERPAVVARDTPSVTDTGDSFWRDAAEAEIRHLAALGVVFDAADVRARIPGEPPHRNVPGQVFSAMRRAGVIDIVGYGPSTRRSVRGAAVALWRGTRRAREGAV